MENISLASVWKEELIKSGWNEFSAQLVPYSLATSTLTVYDKYINQLHSFCQSVNSCFPPNKQTVVANFLCELASQSNRPKSVLNIAMSAINSLCRATNSSNPCSDNIKSLCSALVKTHTHYARPRTNILPMQPFKDLFMSWKDNHELSLKLLRLKTITLLAFSFMLRPSDIAPNGIVFDGNTNSLGQLVFCRDQVQFHDDGGLTLTFMGIKNDASRDGFKVTIPQTSNEKLDPVRTLKTYMERTVPLQLQPTDPVFVSLNKPFCPISATTVASVLNESIKLAGLDTKMYSAKSFRPSGATRSVNSGMDPDKARRIGRWKTSSVFFEHYVFDKTPANYTDNMFECQKK